MAQRRTYKEGFEDQSADGLDAMLGLQDPGGMFGQQDPGSPNPNWKTDLENAIKEDPAHGTAGRGNTQTSRERAGVQATPQQPNEPSPVATRKPLQTFSPMTSAMSDPETARRLSTPIPSIFSNNQGGQLFGKAGGLLGGGLGVPGGPADGSNMGGDPSDLIQQLLKLLNPAMGGRVSGY